MTDWILVTGFGPFPGVDVNPTQVLAEQFSRTTMNGLKVVARVLDVSFERSAAQVREVIEGQGNAPRAIIHFGVSVGADKIHIERQAVNRKAAGIPDVDGHHYEGDVICSTHALDDVLDTAVDVEALVKSLNQAGLQAYLSDDAGRYVCNSTYFNSLAMLLETGIGSLVLFVHIPSIGSDPEPNSPKATAWTEVRLFSAAKHVLQWTMSSGCLDSVDYLRERA